MTVHALSAHGLVPEAVAEHATTGQPVKRVRRRLGVSWPTIILFAVVISYVNGFWVTSLQITVGSLERSAPPFGRWLRDSTMMLPLYTAGILVAVLLARRWFGRSKRTLVRAAGAGVLIVAVCTLVGIGEVANSAAYDYQLQKEHVDLLEGFNHTQHEATSTAVQTDDCVGTCAAKQATLGLHVRAGTQASALMLITNMLLVTWLLAVGGDRLWKRAQPDRTTGARS
jgi:hypothetical protein